MCGVKILVVPDLKAMNRAVNNHIVEPKKNRQPLRGINNVLDKADSNQSKQNETLHLEIARFHSICRQDA